MNFSKKKYKLQKNNRIFVSKILFKTTILAFMILAISCSKDDEPINDPPGPFTVISLVTKDIVKLDWTKPVDPEKSIVTYTVLMDGQTLATDLNTRTYTVKDLEYSKKFTGKIVAYDNAGLTSEATYSFETEMRPNTAPTAPVLISPAIGVDQVNLNPKLIWKSSIDAEDDAIVYDVYLDKSTNPTTKIAESVSDISYLIETVLDAESTYFWRVVARDAFDAETQSERGEFSTLSLVKAVLATDSPGFSDRAAHTSVVFNNKMWVIGGESCCGGRYSDVWSSTNGQTWQVEKGSKSFSERSLHASAVFKDKIWITGGNSSYFEGGEFSDVWSSVDGATWLNVKSNAAFGGRYGHKMIAFDDKLWIFGGRNANNTIPQHQVWNSTDGINWVKVVENAGISLQESNFIVFNKKMWRIGNHHTAEVYSSTDGITWTLESENVPFGRRVTHSVVQHNGKIWVISGADRGAGNQLAEISDVWYSEDGREWKLAAKNAGYKAVAYHTSVAYKETIFIIAGGGGFRDSFITNDVWRLEF